MSLRVKYIAFITLIHLVFTILLYQVFSFKMYLFVLSEGIILLSLYVSYLLYRALIEPILLMKSGVNAILDEDFNTKFLKTGSGDMDQLINVFNRMLERLRVERLRTEEQAYFLENLINASPIGMIILDYDGKISSINPQAKKYLHFSAEDDYTNLAKVMHPLAQYLSGLDIGASELFIINGIHQYKCQANQIYHKGFYRKFLIIEELSAELLNSEKKAYGKVIRMMAHEVNNSMGAINSILQTVIEFGFTGDEEKDDLKQSLEVAQERNNSLARFVSNFADVIRLPLPNFQEIPLADIIEKCCLVMAQKVKDRNIKLDIEDGSKRTRLKIDPIQMEQVVINLIKNAIESIDQNGEIRIAISDQKPQLIIADNGPGIASENEELLFTPFFSTKPTGQGVGLILIREILTNHKAVFSLATDPDDGLTRFSISFN